MSIASGKPISIIVAVARNWAIGLNNQLLWHIPEDFRWFKKHTAGHPVVMGKRTWESLPVKPLPGRKNVVITDDPLDCFPGAIGVGSIEAAVNQMDANEENFIIGGAMVYRQFLPLAQKVYLTMVDREFDADVWFPEPDTREWKETYREEHLKNEPGYTFLIFERIS
ncbi:MAG: dihydrofolate reductase [Porphyromonadaceae bacterium]|nr:MAG: dihydrofolate reductase [Porphyromonadaceae bacterium]